VKAARSKARHGANRPISEHQRSPLEFPPFLILCGILRKDPKTWDDLLTAAKALTKPAADGKDAQYGFIFPGSAAGI